MSEGMIELRRGDLTRQRQKAVWCRRELTDEIARLDLALVALDWERRLREKKLRAAGGPWIDSVA